MPESRAPESVDILIEGGLILTVDSERTILTDGAIAIRGDRIVAVGKTTDLTGRFRVTRLSTHEIASLRRVSWTLTCT